MKTTKFLKEKMKDTPPNSSYTMMQYLDAWFTKVFISTLTDPLWIKLTCLSIIILLIWNFFGDNNYTKTNPWKNTSWMALLHNIIMFSGAVFSYNTDPILIRYFLPFTFAFLILDTILWVIPKHDFVLAIHHVTLFFF